MKGKGSFSYNAFCLPEPCIEAPSVYDLFVLVMVMMMMLTERSKTTKVVTAVPSNTGVVVKAWFTVQGTIFFSVSLFLELFSRIPCQRSILRAEPEPSHESRNDHILALKCHIMSISTTVSDLDPT